MTPTCSGRSPRPTAISDIYAMGAVPKLALNIMAVSDKMPDEAVREVLRGGYEKAAEAGVIISGGHTIKDQEPKYGLSVTGFARPEEIRLNCTPQAGDVLLLTKALGTGIISSANKADLVSPETYARAVRQMAELNRAGCETAARYTVHSCTDVTGFGLMGHTSEMANGGGVTAVIESRKVPLLPEVLSLAEMGILPEGMYRNRNFAEPFTQASPEVPRALMDVLYEPPDLRRAAAGGAGEGSPGAAGGAGGEGALRGYYRVCDGEPGLCGPGSLTVGKRKNRAGGLSLRAAAVY